MQRHTYPAGYSKGPEVLSGACQWPVVPLECTGFEHLGPAELALSCAGSNLAGSRGEGTCLNFYKFEKILSMLRVGD